MAANRTNHSHHQAQHQRAQTPDRARPRARRRQTPNHLPDLHKLSTGELYTHPGGDYLRKRDPERQPKRLLAQPERLGHKVTLQLLPQAA